MAWTQEQLSNAGVIIKVGQSLGASTRDIQIALMTAMQESGLRNLDYGDRDSIGMFQQRNAWGSRADRLDPYKSTRMFFLGGAAGQRGLFDFENRDSMSLAQAAQSVQVSAFPNAYAKWEDDAQGILSNKNIAAAPQTISQTTLSTQPVNVTVEEQVVKPPANIPNNPLGDVTEGGSLDAMTFEDTSALGGDGPAENAIGALSFDQAADPMAHLHAPSVETIKHKLSLVQKTVAQGQAAAAAGDVKGWRAAIVKAARQMLGVPYVWGGTSYSGVDCSGLIQLLFKEQGFNLPRISADQARYGKRIGFKDLQAGDLVALDNSSRNNGADHIAIYIGNGQVIEAPRPGKNVQIVGLDAFSGGWGVQMPF